LDKEDKKIDSTDTEPSWGDLLKNFAFIAVFVGIAYFVSVKFGIADIRRAVASSGIWAPLVIIVLKAMTIIVVPLGGTPLYPIAGAIFGFGKGLLITLLGDALGSAVAFAISKYFGKSLFAFFMPKQYMPIVEKLIDRVGEMKGFLKARIFFTGFPELFAYAAGFTKIPFWFFLPVHVGIHALPASLLVIFGDVIVSGNKMVLIIVGVVTSLLAMTGIWWFHLDLKREN